MARILAIDYGSKRTGLAVTDPLQIIATALDTVPTHTLVDFLKKYFETEEVEKVVIGMPKGLNNQHTETTVLVERFVKQFSKQFPALLVFEIDERFTSKMASQAILMSGVKKKERQNKALIDTVSATIILQSYLENQAFIKRTIL